MYREFGNSHYHNGFAELGLDPAAIARSQVNSMHS
jgi:hypothetical protein